MKFARLFLVGIMLVVAGVDAWLIYRAVPSDRFGLANMLWILTGPLVATALCVLVFSYTKVDRQNGQLVLDRNSLYVKLVGGWWSDKKNPWPGEQISICALFWASVVPIGSIMLLAWAILGAVPYGIAHLVMNPPSLSDGISAPNAETWTMLGLSIGSLVLFVIALLGSVALLDQFKRKTIGLLAAILTFFLGALVVISGVVIGSLVGDKHLPLKEAALMYWDGFKVYAPWVLLWVAVGLVSIAAAVGIIALIVVSVQALRKTVVGELAIGMWQAFKDKACPIVKISGAMNVVVEETPTETPTEPTEPPADPVEPAKS
ncbi:MAG: hypothetical protein G01um101419_400 [Parcubacteria group bacterium Gr01-1014_19]|nr:MAG: hypothetical protein G01um101419_400 [Parcubacteria group bacterium Gr01-1014_19]